MGGRTSSVPARAARTYYGTKAIAESRLAAGPKGRLFSSINSSDLPVIELSRRPSFSALFSVVQEPQIALAALTRLRWLAVIGQITATLVAVLLLHLRLPLIPIATVILITAFSNVLLTFAL